MLKEYEVIFKLNDDNKTCIFKDREYEIHIDKDTNERFILAISSNKKIKCRFIENEQQINNVLNTDNNTIDFFNCIFLIDPDFNSKTFTRKANFNSVIFTRKANFNSATFIKKADFNSAIFEELAFFNSVTFTRKANFRYVTFAKKANFRHSIFNEQANFDFSVFKELAYFYFSTFRELANFCLATFKEQANFHFSTFRELANFRYAKICFFILTNIRTNKDFSIDLKLAEIEKLNYEDTDFIDAKNSETFLLLKNFALKNNDQKSALIFYKKEMEKYRKEADKNRKSIDMFVLTFEKWISEYGTNPFRPLIIMFSISIIFTLFLMIYLSSIDFFSLSILLLNPTSSLEKLNIVEKTINIPKFLEALNFIKNIFFGILIYETIKSFRKFSRKL